ncbi:MAG: dephospho-CoA kinase [Butyricicoccaceae bacterium]
MKIIGLTGGSGTGKGTVAARMRALGAGWVDADAVYRTLCARRTAKCCPRSIPPSAA